MATLAVERPRLRIGTRQLLLTILVFVAGNLWVAWLCANVSSVDALSAKSDGIVSLRQLPENPYRSLIRGVVIGLVYNAIMLTGVAFLVLVNYLEDERRLRLGLPPNAAEEGIFGSRARVRGVAGHPKAPPRLSRQIRPGVRVDLRCHLRPRLRSLKRD